MTHVTIHDLSNHTSYKAYKESDCKDKVDLSAYKSCWEHMDVITMGMVIAKPCQE